MSDSSHLIFNSKEYELPEQFKKLLDISKNIYRKLIKGECKYEVQSQVSEEVFKSFVEYLIDGTDIEIHLDTIYELKQLADEFEISELLKKIQTKKDKWREIEKVLEQQQYSTSSSSEEEASKGKISTEQKILQICETLEYQNKKINELIQEVDSLKENHEKQVEELQQTIQSLTIEYEKEIAEQERRFEIRIEETMNQNNEQRLNDNKKQEKSINEQFQKIKELVDSNLDLIQKQYSEIQNHTNKFEQVNNQFSSVKDEIGKIYITKDISNSIFIHQISFLFF